MKWQVEDEATILINYFSKVIAYLSNENFHILGVYWVIQHVNTACMERHECHKYTYIYISD